MKTVEEDEETRVLLDEWERRQVGHCERQRGFDVHLSEVEVLMVPSEPGLPAPLPIEFDGDVDAGVWAFLCGGPHDGETHLLPAGCDLSLPCCGTVYEYAGIPTKEAHDG